MFTANGYKQFKHLMKFLSAVMLMALIFVFSFSFIYIVKEAGHECEGGVCSVCLSVKQCEDNVKLRTGVEIGSLQISSVTNFALFFFIPKEVIFEINTPVKQKVRLDN